jgi:hypothetical protein
VKFTDDELIGAKTIGDLAESISKKMEHPLSEKCLSAVVFYRVRRTLINLFDIPRDRITPERSLYELMPWNDRRKRWRRIQDHLGFVLPDLRWPLWLAALSLVIVATVFTLPPLGWARFASFAGSASVLFTLVGGFCAWILLLKLLTPVARSFPRSCESMGDFVKLALGRNYAKIASEHGLSSAREIVLILRQLIAAEEGIDVEEIVPDTLFPEGLKIY